VQRVAGPQAEAVLKAVSRWRGPERLLDLGLRGGPYGDQFGLRPEGLNLKKLQSTPAGIDLGPLSSRVPEVLRTPSGKVELAPPTLLQDLKRAAQRLEDPVPELVIIGRRQVRSNNSWMHNLPVLAKGRNRCTVLVSPADAARLELADGGRARIVNDGRAVEAEVEISDQMMTGVASLPHGWGHDLPQTALSVAARQPGANLNALLDTELRDRLSGNAVLSGVAVQITAA
jgi:anaerobic selenocysteine-containing dehydrogenase